MKPIYFFLCSIVLLLSCTKEVKVKIPGFQQKVVVEGRIEQDLPPIFLLSQSQDVFSPTHLTAYINSFITDAEIYVNNGIATERLTLFCSDNLPPGTLQLIADMLGIPVATLLDQPFCAYSTLNPAFFGRSNTRYSVRIEHKDKIYEGATYLHAPKPMDTLYWKEIVGKPNYGYTHARYSDTPGEYDAFMWEVKRLNSAYQDFLFKKPFTAVFEDVYTDGASFAFYQTNPFTYETGPEQYRGLFPRGDTLIIRTSRIDKAAYDFEATRLMQAFSNGNPFSSPMNVKSNLSGGCLGTFSAFATVYDTLICQ